MLGEPWTLGWSASALILSALVLVVAGWRFTSIVDQLADRTGIGEAAAGAILLGATTSLPGVITTGVAAANGAANLAVSNALGGIAAQTMFLALADLAYPRANLEHAAASLPNLLQTMVLTGLIGVVLVGTASPDVAIGHMHPVSFLLPAAYLGGLILLRNVRRSPMWSPKRTDETREDEPAPEALRASLPGLLTRFAILGFFVAASGFVVAKAGLSLAAQTELSGSFVGAVFTSIVTSLPELVTVIAAVRTGALALAVGDIIGGNTFDVLFLVVGDAAYTAGPIYGATTAPTLFVLGLTIVMTSLLGTGLVYREKAGIGFEGISIIVCYLIGVVVLYFL